MFLCTHAILKLDIKNTFKKITVKTDDLGFTHTNFQQYYNGYEVEGKIVLVHSKNGFVQSINGQILEDLQLESNISIKEK